MVTDSPNMGLVVPVVAVDTGLVWEQSIEADLAILDGHNHSAGSGVQINPDGININADFPFNDNNAVTLRSTRYQQQVGPLTGASDLNCLYVETDGNLYFNDGAGDPAIQITKAGAVNATSSGIVSGTASASFVSSVLVVDAAANTPANIQVASVLLGNNTAGTDFVTLSPPNALSSDYTLTLPQIPSVTSIMTLDSAGNMAADLTVDGSTLVINSGVISVNTPELMGITGSQLAANTITTNQIASGTITLANIANSTLSWGTYTPTLSNFYNTGGITAEPCQFMRVGNVVTVSGALVVASGGVFSCDMTAPVFSGDIAQPYQVAGSGVSRQDPGAGAGTACISGLPGTPLIQFKGYTTVSGTDWFSFSFTYLVF
jgi:hypothetical protein